MLIIFSSMFKIPYPHFVLCWVQNAWKVIDIPQFRLFWIQTFLNIIFISTKSPDERWIVGSTIIHFEKIISAVKIMIKLKVKFREIYLNDIIFCHCYSVNTLYFILIVQREPWWFQDSTCIEVASTWIWQKELCSWKFICLSQMMSILIFGTYCITLSPRLCHSRNH